MRRLALGLALAGCLLSGCGSGDESSGSSGCASGSGASGGAAGAGGSSGGGSGGTAAKGGMGGAAGAGGATTKLGIAGDRFSVNGAPTFLLGVSYFDGKSWHVSDLDLLAAKKFNLIRVWLDWASNGFFDADGKLSAKTTLQDLVHAAGERGIVVDVTILDTDLTLSSPTTAVQEVVAAIGDEPNVLFDLVNEHDHAGDTFTHADVTGLSQAARATNPNVLLTVSSQGGHIVDDLTLNPANVDAEIVDAGLDLLSPHLTRTADFYDKTDQRVALIKTYLASISKDVPVYLQEEARRGHSGLDPTKDQFLQAATEARDSGAAAWIFHTDAGFNLQSASFFDSLDPIEKDTVDALGAAVFGG